MAIKKSDLYSSLWASCDLLRGGMDASQYKDYVLFMLFIKYISDKYANSDDFAPPVTIPKGASFADMIALKGKSDIGDKINTQIIQPLIDANSRLARSDFPDFNDPNKLGEGKDMVDRLTSLVGVFQNPELDFSKNRAEHDDILGDAYEYLMRHFATESGKSKGQFYTPSEVSRVIAHVIGITPQNTKASTTAYDPTCGSGSLLLKVAEQAGKHITLEGQEKDVATAGLARMNMILHNFPTANILQGNTLASPKFKDGEQLRTYDYVVANPPFSDKTWSTGLVLGESGTGDSYQRFTWGVPPGKQGDYAYLLHIIRSMKSKGKAACILPHGVLFRGNAEAVIREQLVRSGYLKGIIGLPANLFYGTGIPACILVLDKENAATRKGVFLIDASKGCIKDGNKNRLREQDIHKIVDTFANQIDTPRYARLVDFDEIKKHEFNLNLPRYIDSTEAEDIQDIDGHLRGGIPLRDIEALARYWAVCPNLQKALFKKCRAGYVALAVDKSAIKNTIFDHPEFTAFVAGVNEHYNKWRAKAMKSLKALALGCHPKQIIAEHSEGLLRHFQGQPLVDAYDIYQHFMNYWSATMQDDCYLISAVSWVKGVQPREILKVKNKDNKLVWSEEHDYLKGKRRFKSDLIPASLLVVRYFQKEKQTIEGIDAELAALEQQLDEMRDENSGEEGLLSEVIEGEGDKQKITAKAVKDRMKEIGTDPDFADERQTLKAYQDLLDKQSNAKARHKKAVEELDAKIDAKYPKLTESEVKTLVVDDKWMAALDGALHGELDRVSQTLTTRVKELADRYDTPLPKLTDCVADLEVKVNGNLERMGFSWK
jgi:type I restriction enzyme M protein